MTILNEFIRIAIFDAASAREALGFFYTAIVVIFLIVNRKRKRVYGIVFDASTLKPLSYAIVALLRPGGKVTRTAVTDEKGRYRITSPEGDFYLSVSRASYLSISKKFKGKKSVGPYHNLYSGGTVHTQHANPIISVDIPLTPENPGPLSPASFLEVIWYRSDRYLKSLFLLLTILWAIVDFGVRPLIFLALETTFYIASIVEWKSYSHRWGIVKNARSGKPVPFAKVELIDATTSQLIDSSSTDLEGRYTFLVLDFRKMYIRCRRPGYRSYRSDTLRFFGLRSEKVDLVGINLTLQPDPAASAQKRGEVVSFLDFSHEDVEAERQAELSRNKKESGTDVS